MRIGSAYQDDFSGREYPTRVTRKGQITVPVEVRRALGLREGDNVAVLLDGDQVMLERRPSITERTAGALKSTHPPLTPQQEQEAFERGVAEEVGGNPER